MKLIDR